MDNTNRREAKQQGFCGMNSTKPVYPLPAVCYQTVGSWNYQFPRLRNFCLYFLNNAVAHQSTGAWPCMSPVMRSRSR